MDVLYKQFLYEHHIYTRMEKSNVIVHAIR